MNSKVKNWLINQLKGDDKGDKWGHRWRGTQKIRYEETIEFVKRNLDINKNYDILDIGCSHGDFTKIIYETFTKSKIYATDISEVAIEAAKKLVDNANYEVSELPDLPFKNKKFDIIFAVEVLYYLNENERMEALMNIFNKLNSNSYFIFSSVIDDGSRYFTEKDAIDKIGKYFEILDIGYTHTKGAIKFESIFMKLIYYYNIIRNIDEYNTKNFSSTKKKLAVKLLSNNLINNVFRFAIFPFFFISEQIVSNKTIMNLIKNITIICSEKKTRGNILILGMKR
jgi:SAM-dependent methyltransferase